MRKTLAMCLGRDGIIMFYALFFKTSIVLTLNELVNALLQT